MALAGITLNAGTGGATAQSYRNSLSVSGTPTNLDADAVVLVDQFGVPIGGATATATITATDAVVAAPAGLGAFVSGASTAGSISAIQVPGGDSIFNCQITGLTSGTLWFEGSLDTTNGTDGNWMVATVLRDGVLQSIVQQSATANGLYSGNASGYAWLRVRSVGTLTGTPAVRWRLSPGVSEVYLASSIPPGTNAIGKVDTESTKASYISGGTLNPAATPTDVVQIKGSATKTVKVRRVSMQANATTAGAMTVSAIKRLAANTGGTFNSSANTGPIDTTDAAASAAAGFYSVNPTALGAQGALFQVIYLPFPLVANAIAPTVIEFGTRGAKPILLRGVAESFVLNFNGGAVPAGGTLSWSVEWTEE